MLLTTWEKLNSPSQQMSVAASFEMKRKEHWGVYHLFVFLVIVQFLSELYANKRCDTSARRAG